MITETISGGTFAPHNPSRLPEGMRHGTLAAIRRGCCCRECLDKRARMRRHGYYVR